MTRWTKANFVGWLKRVEEVMNDVMTAEDAGTVWTVDEGDIVPDNLFDP